MKSAFRLVMPNPNPKQTPEFLQAKFKPKADQPLGKVVGVRFPADVDAILAGMGEGRADYIRTAVEQRMREEGLLQNEPDEQN